MSGLPRSLRNTVIALRARWRRIRSAIGSPHTAPVFVLGNQKSGTTVVAALLGARIGARQTLDAFHQLSDPTIEERVFDGSLDLADFVRDHPGLFRHPVIKDPSFTFFHDELQSLFPKARFAFVVRDPRDNVRSILNRLDIPGTTIRVDSEAVRRAVAQAPGWRGVMEARNPTIDEPTLPAVLAMRWRMAARVYLDAPDEIELIRYEDFRADRAAAIVELASRLGFPEGQDISSLVDRQYQPKGDNSLPWEEFFGPVVLDIIVRTCREEMIELGYQP